MNIYIIIKYYCIHTGIMRHFDIIQTQIKLLWIIIKRASFKIRILRIDRVADWSSREEGSPPKVYLNEFNDKQIIKLTIVNAV